jgi:hypothetical protein
VAFRKEKKKTCYAQFGVVSSEIVMNKITTFSLVRMTCHVRQTWVGAMRRQGSAASPGLLRRRKGQASHGQHRRITMEQFPPFARCLKPTPPTRPINNLLATARRTNYAVRRVAAEKHLNRFALVRRAIHPS